MQPSAARRIEDYYVATDGMPPKNLTQLLDLDVHGTQVSLTTSAAALSGNVLTFASTASVLTNVPVFGPNIVKGTTVIDISPNVVTLSQTIAGPIPLGAVISFGLPTVIDGYVLPAFTSANAFDVTAFDTIGFDIHSGILDVDYDGGDNPLDPNAIQVSVNPATQYRPYGLGLRDPYYAANHPQERLPFTGDDGLQMTVTTMPQAGGPPQIIWLFDVSGDDGTTATLFFSELPHASDAVLVYRDGVRATFGSDYTVDYFGRTVTVDIVGVDLVQIHSFGFGGTSTINANPTTMLDNRYFFAFSSNPLTLQQSTDVNHARVIVNGTALTSSQYSVNGNQVTLATPPATGSDVAIVIYDGGVSTATEIQFETLTYNINQQWTLNPVDSITEPGHGGTIVEVNGIRLRPPTTFYGQFTSNQLWMYLPLSPEVGDTYSVYVDGVLYTTAIPFCTTTSPSSLYPFKLVIPTGQTPPTNVAGQFVFFGGLLVALDPTFSSNNVAIVIIPQGTHPDYQITNGVLTIHPTLSAGDLITVFSFSNASSMGWQTVTYDYVYTPYIISIPYDRDYALVAFDGLAKAPYVDYDIMNFDVGWDTLPLDSAPYDIIFEAAELVLSPSAISAGPYSWVVASLCTQPPAHGLLQWMSYTTTPSFNRMPAALKADGTQVTAVPNHSQAMQPLPQYDTRYGSIRLSPYLAGTLAQTLAPTDTQMVVNLLLRSIAPKLEPALPLPTVFGNEPAVVWINGERIEYFGYARNGQTVTLSGLRRGTQGTSIQEQRVIGTGPGTGGSATYPVNAVGTVEVMVNGQPVAINGFSTHVSGGTTYVTLTAPVGQEVVIAITTGYTYSVGAVVYNGEEPFVLPMPRESQAIVVAPPPSTPPISDTRPIGGVGASGSAGGLSIFTHRSISQAITGVTLSGSAGRPTITGSQLLQRAITGVSLTGSAGKPTIGNTTVARAITGVLSTTGIGKLTVSNIGGTLSRAITGVSSSGASGTPTISSTSGGGGSGIPMQNHSLYYISGTANAASINPANVASGQAALPGTGFDVVIVEATNDGVGGDASHFWTSQQVASMRKTSNTKVFGYFDIQAETQRCYYSSSTAAGTGWTGPTLKGSNIVGGTPNNWGEYGIQIWTSAYYQITQLWIQRLVAAGFDGIYFDVSDTWTDTQYVQPNAPAVPAGSPGAPPAGFAAKSASAAAWWETQFFMDMRAYGRTLNPNFLVAENAGEGMLDAGANTYLLTHASDAAYIGPRLIQACDFFYREEVLYQSYNGGYKGTVGIVTDPSDDYGNLSQIVAAGKPVGLCEYVGAGTNANAIGGGTVNCPVLGTVTVQAGSTAAIHYIRQVCAAWNFGFYVSVADFTVSAGPTLSVVDTDGILIP
jgi:endo-alpha-1,4-polygalactosaminidase (GH114 family)